jgi:hypothetical protein
MRLSVRTADKEVIESPESADRGCCILELQKRPRSWPRRVTLRAGAATLFLVLFGFGFDALRCNAQSIANNVATVDGVRYPYTADGVQDAIDAVSRVALVTGIGGAVKLPAATIDLGSRGLAVRTRVCLVGVSSESSWLAYSGTGSAITFAPGTRNACLQHIAVNMSGAGTNAVGISLQGNFAAGLSTEFTRIEDVQLTASPLEHGQTGLKLEDLSSELQPAPSGVSLSWFDGLEITNLGQPIVIRGQEGNFWNDIHIAGFSSIAVNDNFSSDNFWQLRLSGITPGSATGFLESGRMNHISLTCDFGQGGRTCLNDVNGRNIWLVSAITPVGAVAPSSFLEEIAGLAHGIPSSFQVSNAAVTRASSPMSLGSNACLEMGNANGDAGTNYVTFQDGTMSVSTSKPASCR